MAINVSIKSFAELSNTELYDVLHLRNQVFIVEQNCVYLDLDHKDQASLHLLMYEGNSLVAYSRLLPGGVSYKEVSIGRVIVSPNFRDLGLGKKLVAESIKACYNFFGESDIKIGAQIYLQKFYRSFGFIEEGEAYDEDGIMHVTMVKPFMR